jgi:hypothetical protein
MQAELESGTDIAEHVLYDPSIGKKVTGDEVEAAAKAGTLLAMYTAGDGALAYRLIVDEELPENLRARISTSTKDVLLRVPSGKLICSGLEYVGDPAKAEGTVEVPAGNYLVDAHELDYDWDRDIDPILRAELPGYRRERTIGPIAGFLTIAGIGTAVGGAIALHWIVAIAGVVALLAGIGLLRSVTGKAYSENKAAIARRFPGLVLVLRKLDDAADLTAHAGKQLTFVD